MPNPHHISPAALANARAVVVISADSRFHPAVIGGAWATMKAARGEGFHADRLRPAHLIDPDDPTALPATAADTIDTITERATVRARFRAAMLQGLPLRGGIA